MTAAAGQCLCGAVQYEAVVDKLVVGACHCRMCQQWTGGPLLAVTADKVAFDGEEQLLRYSSSKWAERGFCGKCGSNLFYRLANSDSYEMCLGTFDDPDQFAMEGEIFIDKKPNSYAFAGDHPRLTEVETFAKYKEYSGS